MRKKIKKAVGGTIRNKKYYSGFKLSDGKPVIFSREGLIRSIQAKEIADIELQKEAMNQLHNDRDHGNQLEKAINESYLKKELKNLDKLIDAKKAGMAAGTKGKLNSHVYPFRSHIPTLTGTVQDKKTKRETDKYLKQKRITKALKSFGKNIIPPAFKNITKKKAGGRVKKVKAHRGDGIAKRGRTRGRIV